MIKDKFTFWTLTAGVVMDILIIWWVFKTFDVIPDQWEEIIKNIF